MGIHLATRCVEAEFEIKSLIEILGRANTAITLNLYIHSPIKLKRSNMNKLAIADLFMLLRSQILVSSDVSEAGKY